jgi:5,5'-dehydrodivanillate O-demethylase
VLFPNILKVGHAGRGSYQFRVPVDDTHTYHVAYQASTPKEGQEPTARVPVEVADVFDPVRNRFKVETNRGLAQDVMAWITQGPVMDRSEEHLGDSDRGVILYRRLLNEQARIAQDGGDPLNVFRDPAEAAYVHVQTEEDKYVATVGSGERVSFGGFGIFGDRRDD